jgi:VWFA-related protein
MKFGPTFLAALAVAAQTAPPTIRVNVNLIQVDATVTRDGKRVSDLTAADFEVYQNGKKQPIRSVLWVPGQRVNQLASAGAAPAQSAKSPDTFRLEDIRRTIVIVVDDSSLTPFSMFVTQQAVRKIIDETMGGQDLVAVYRTSNPRTLMQQFTTNKTQVLAAIDWMSKSAPAAPEPLRPPDSSVLQFTSRSVMAARQMETQFQQEVYERVTKDFKTASMLGVVNLAVTSRWCSSPKAYS